MNIWHLMNTSSQVYLLSHFVFRVCMIIAGSTSKILEKYIDMIFLFARMHIILVYQKFI